MAEGMDAIYLSTARSGKIVRPHLRLPARGPYAYLPVLLIELYVQLKVLRLYMNTIYNSI
eukprot:SAG31_NODE_551_length_14207_cov_7.887440_1_plen_60_part_00